MRRQRGFTMIEIIFVLAIFGLFILMLVITTAEFRAQDKRYPVNYMRHPQVVAVVARIRKDVIDAFGADPYPPSYGEFTQSPTTLIVYSIQESGFAQTIVWEFGTPGEVRRHAFSTGAQVSEWVARGVPRFTVSPFEIPNRPYGVRLRAVDPGGMLAIDQILQPRAH